MKGALGNEHPSELKRGGKRLPVEWLNQQRLGKACGIEEKREAHPPFWDTSEEKATGGKNMDLKSAKEFKGEGPSCARKKKTTAPRGFVGGR